MQPTLTALALALHDVSQILAPRGWTRIELPLALARAGHAVAFTAETRADAGPKPNVGDRAHHEHELTETLQQIDVAVAHEQIAWRGDSVALVRDADGIALQLEDVTTNHVHTARVDQRMVDGICVVTEALLDALAQSEALIVARQRELAARTQGLRPADVDILKGTLLLAGATERLLVATEPIAHYDASVGELGWGWAYQELAPIAGIVAAARVSWLAKGAPGFVARPGLFATDRVLAYQLASLAAAHADIIGVYCFEYDRGAYYLAVKAITAA